MHRIFLLMFNLFFLSSFLSGGTEAQFIDSNFVKEYLDKEVLPHIATLKFLDRMPMLDSKMTVKDLRKVRKAFGILIRFLKSEHAGSDYMYDQVSDHIIEYLVYSFPTSNGAQDVYLLRCFYSIFNLGVFKSFWESQINCLPTQAEAQRRLVQFRQQVRKTLGVKKGCSCCIM